MGFHTQGLKQWNRRRDPERSHVPSALLASLLLQDGVRMSLLINDNDNNNIVVFLIIQGQYGPSSKIKLGKIHSVPELWCACIQIQKGSQIQSIRRLQALAMLPGGEGGRKGWLEVWDQHVCTAVFEVGGQQSPAACHRRLCSELSDSPHGSGAGRELTHVCERPSRLLGTWSQHSVVNKLYPGIKQKGRK